jgi:hypothetical protein
MAILSHVVFKGHEHILKFLSIYLYTNLPTRTNKDSIFYLYYVQEINIISTDQKLMCPIHFQHKLINPACIIKHTDILHVMHLSQFLIVIFLLQTLTFRLDKSQINLLASKWNKMCEWFLPGIHLDHLDANNYLIHEPDALICSSSCAQA